MLNAIWIEVCAAWDWFVTVVDQTFCMHTWSREKGYDGAAAKGAHCIQCGKIAS